VAQGGPIKVFIPELWHGFVLRVVAAACREAKARGLDWDTREDYVWETGKPGGTTFIFEGPDAKKVAAIYREKIKEMKKAGPPSR
jgi:hypothetical protein